MIVGPGVSVVFDSAGDTLIVDAGARFVGDIVGGGGALVVNGGAGELSGLFAVGGMSGSDSGDFSGFASITIGGQWTLTGDGSLSAGDV